ncbi:beta-ketoacyl synthase N-terminal-like domain-containing protein [Bradyrhizobium sp. RDM12]
MFSQQKVSIVTAIAVVGIGCRLPGYIDTPDALRGALLAGIDFVTDIPQQRRNADDYYAPVAGAPSRSVSRWGAFLDDPWGFDHRFPGIGDPEAFTLDSLHRLLLEVAWEAAEHSGRDPRRLPIALEADTEIRLRVMDVTTVRALADPQSGPMQELQPAGADARD